MNLGANKKLKGRAGFSPARPGVVLTGCKPNSVCALASGENHLSERPVPETRLAPWSGQLRGPLFGLAPDGVFLASRITPEAVVSYSTVSPLPSLATGRYRFCGTVRQLQFDRSLPRVSQP